MKTVTLENAADCLAWIVERAAAGQPPPSNDEICGRYELRSVSSAVRLIHVLEEQGSITVTRYNHGREIKVASSGAVAPSSSPSRAPHVAKGMQRMALMAVQARHLRRTADALPAAVQPLPQPSIPAPRSCRFPLWKNKPDFHYCGEPVVSLERNGEALRTSYCEAHYRLCHAVILGKLVQ